MVYTSQNCIAKLEVPHQVSSQYHTKYLPKTLLYSHFLQPTYIPSSQLLLPR
uniref:Uncharacterized protein n=1 Tax=Arundo donax TaxID=35708 RepID=A0A0A9AQT7_ARUDO